jgi:hypothetical protein
MKESYNLMRRIWRRPGPSGGGGVEADSEPAAAFDHVSLWPSQRRSTRPGDPLVHKRPCNGRNSPPAKRWGRSLP